MWDKPKIAIIGMGFLMSYLKPCYHHVIGDDLSKNIVASTATASTTEKSPKLWDFLFNAEIILICLLILNPI